MPSHSRVARPSIWSNRIRLLTRRKNQIADFRHVDTGGQQINSDSNVGILLVLEAADQVQRLVRRAGNLDHGVIVDAAVTRRKSLFEQIGHQVGVRIGSAEDQRLLPRQRIELLRQIVADHAIERFGDDFAVEILNVEFDFVRRFKQFDLVIAAVENFDVVSCFPGDTLRGKHGFDLDRRFVIHQKTVDYRFAVAVTVHRQTENLRGVQGRRRGQADFDGIEIIQHAAVF